MHMNTQAIASNKEAELDALINVPLDIAQDYSSYTDENRETWRQLFTRLEPVITQYAHPDVKKGIAKLGLSADAVPHLPTISQNLKNATGWQVYVCEGVLDIGILCAGYTKRYFPSTVWLRALKDIDYTPLPDMVHEVVGHLGVLAGSQEYADALHEFGMLAKKFEYDEEILSRMEAIHWFLFEFQLIEHEGKILADGPGLVSSLGEEPYSVESDKPRRHMLRDMTPEQVYRELMDARGYDISEFQKDYFVIPDSQFLLDFVTKHLPELVVSEPS